MNKSELMNKSDRVLAERFEEYLKSAIALNKSDGLPGVRCRIECQEPYHSATVEFVFPSDLRYGFDIPVYKFNCNVRDVYKVINLLSEQFPILSIHYYMMISDEQGSGKDWFKNCIEIWKKIGDGHWSYPEDVRDYYTRLVNEHIGHCKVCNVTEQNESKS